MYKFSQSEIINSTREVLCDVILDIEKYPEFLPWCKEAKIVNHYYTSFLKKAENIGADVSFGRLYIGFDNITKYYDSKIIYHSYQKYSVIKAISVSDLFQELTTIWEVSDMDDERVLVKFYIQFSFKSFLLNSMMGPFFKKACNMMVNAFKNRINQLK